MRYDLVIFDLDGTILDTLDDLGDAVNHVLAEAGFPARTQEEVRRFIGNGVVNLIRRSAPQGISEDVERALLEGFRARYAAHLNDRTRPYAGICELMSDLRGAGVHVAVNSNKPDAAVKALCRAHFGALVEIALGERADMPKKPDPEGARQIMAALGAAPDRTLYVGDGDADIRTAGNAGTDCAWVSWGFRRREELAGLTIPRAFDSPRALRAFLLEDA